MKKIIFSIVGSTLISLCALQAQQYDTTGTARQSDQTREQSDRTQQREERPQQREQMGQHQDQARQQQSDRDQNRNAYANEGMVIIEKDELPSSLKQKLEGDKYEGWKNATIYHNTNTGEYVIAPRAYRFDSQGNEIEINSVGYDDRQQRTSRYSQDQQSGTSQQDGQGQAREQMGEIPTSAPEDQAQGEQRQQPGQSERDDQSSHNQQSREGQQYDQSTQSQQQSDAYRTDDNQQDQSAQQPSSTYRTDQGNQAGRTDDASTQSQSQYVTDNMVEIQAEQIPESLRSTLNEGQYRGWEENGTLYQDPSSSEYILVMDKTENSTQPKVYRFDHNGELQKDQAGSSQRNNGQ
jgi:hypothetical protein